MTTLAIMKARIGTEIRRPGLTTQIASAISTAIASYVDERIFYSESRDVSFATVVSQSLYTSSDHASLALLEQIDYVHLIVDSQNFRLRYMDPEAIERASSSTTSTGQPTDFSWYQEKLRVFPAPSSADWDIRVAGLFQVAAPASDNEASNKWMTDGERLIRSRAKWELAQHVLFDDELATRMEVATLEAFRQLKIRTSRKTEGGQVVPMAF